MPRPFLELTLQQCSDLLVSFPWTRKITEVHVHHTFRPNHADFAARPPLQAIEGMFRFHTEERHFSDIAQHITIDPTGKIWTGRNWNVAPASATGFNGSAAAGPFMFEMIGDFDKGRDKWTGAQRESAIQIIARVQKRFGLPPSAFRFHNEMSTKSCPGTAIAKADVLKAVTQAHAQLAAPAATRSRAAVAAASRDRDTTALLLQMFNVQTTPRTLETDGELPESAMALRDLAISAGDSPAVSTRAGDAGDLTAEDRTRLRRHVVNLRMGALSSGGEFQTTEDDVRAMFTEHIPAFASRPQGQPLRLVFFAHGGLNDELGSLKSARNRIDFYLQNGCYPIFFVWETGAKETLIDILRRFGGLASSRALGDAVTAASDPLFEAATRGAGTSLWINMKRSAEFSFLQKGGGRFVVNQLVEFWKNHSSEMEVHAIGHSAGAIFHAEFLEALCSQPVNPPVSIKTVSFLAPAITVDLFKEKVKPLVGGRIERFTEYTMRQDFELQDAVGPYGKSLLYLVSRAFEDQPKMPILGLEESLRADPDMLRFFGLGAARKGPGEIVFSVTEAGVSDSSLSRTHGDFDNDRLTMSGVIRRILATPDDAQVVEFPETVSRGLFDDDGPADGTGPMATPAARFSTPALASPNGTGQRRALCVGIDKYAAPYQLAGCVNDAKDWAKALRGLGFETTMMVNDAATWQALRTALSDLVASARPGDVVVFQYAGHGSRVADLDGDEQGGMDSALCPVDFSAGGFLIDDDVRAILGALADGVNFTCFFDCCHSGTITRMLAPSPALRAAGDVRIRGLRATSEMEAAHRAFRSALGAEAPRQRTAATMREVSFTACLDTQTAKEVGGHGQFTARALTLLRGNLAALTNGAFHERVVSAFGGTALDQDPQLDCAPASKARVLLAPVTGPPASDGTGIAAPRDLLLSRLDEIERRLARLEE